MMTKMKGTGEPPENEATEMQDSEAHLVEYTVLKGYVDEFLDATQDPRTLSERCRDYYDGKQWTPDQIRELKRRKQAPIVNNRIKVKHNGLLGLISIRKGDPQAYPRNQENDSNSAEVVTDGLRYAADKARLNPTFAECADNFFCEGYTAAHVCIETTPRGDKEVTVDQIPWDRIFFDPYARKHDFMDARGKGYMMWMDEQDITDTFPDADPDALSVQQEISQGSGETFEDKPSWFLNRGKRRRHLVATHYFKLKGTWYLAIYTGSGYLLPPMESPYQDEYDQPECPIEIEHAYIDREGNRYGELAAFLDLQDEINHRRSKGLFYLSQRQTFGNRGAVKDVKKAKRELAKPDGHLEVGQGEFGKDFGILPTGDMAQGQLELLQEAKAEIDAQGYNAQLSGDRQQGDLSGKAIGKLQQAGVNELNKIFDNFSGFKLRVYRQMWNRMRQFWDAEKWIRVTDDSDAPRYVGFNVPITYGQFLQEVMDDDSKPHAMKIGAAAELSALEQQNPQALEQVVMSKNVPAEMDMDITLDESYDVINASQEQLQSIMEFGAQGQFDIIDLLELSNIKGKKKLIEKIQKRRSEAAQSAGQDPASQMAAAKSQLDQANAEKVKAESQQTQLETQILQQEAAMGIPFKGTVSA